MRLDKFLNAVNITKRRSLAQDMCKSGVILVNGIQSKGSKEVQINDIITLNFLESSTSYRVLQIPTLKTIPKSQKDQYVERVL
ncbi:RNA-binding S4 domain-containing protein [Helicobacter muridarum]|uniref:RNA-binding S4 domain-containing protein n=1 Tax=Helicobacter muridarum TaxID=216 RepID=A0A099TVB0_9HELI|nr:RNA-binding S4 domain-containing protein [Helicobacter muridarum]TLD98591.1 RNA-binding S4 domain-containing protein [Helicobacter muridarum]STQ85523.1 RNA-binding S4 domain-containing protein [Helicobacter muridarum]